jgi:large subunit ribosomal protein L11
LILPAIISVYKDKSFDFVIKTPPSAVLLKKAANLAKASGSAGKEKIGSLKRSQVVEIAKTKMEDLNTTNLERAIRTIEGTARSMGIEILAD